mgnify:CR=1 FL=1|tara:strand:+ start:685 stop:1347 length:663 start_codon:yes stop_codon:yes gene_type:complete
MAYTAEFLAAVAEKPKHLSPNDKARVFAGKGGWYLRDLTTGNAPELIMSIPGLSDILDRGTDGNQLADSVKKQLMVQPTDVGFNRRSRRRYSIIVGLHEQIKAVGADVVLELDINGTSTAGGKVGTTAQNVAGGDIKSQLTVGTKLECTIADGATVGKLEFPLPLLTVDPGKLIIQLAASASIGAKSGSDLGNLQDSEGLTQGQSIAHAVINGTEVTIIP